MRTSQAPPGCVDVLIAEDDAPLRSSLRFLLEQQGFSCAEACNGREALILARHWRPRCVLLDLGMPELDGLAVARRLRRDPRTRGTRIHCLTGRSDAASRKRAHRAGCETVLLKPVDPERILKVLRQARKNSREWWVSGLTKTQAEDWLDWLQGNNFPPGELLFLGDNGYAVRCPRAVQV